MPNPTILAIDPGGTTGIALTRGATALVKAETPGRDYAYDAIEALIHDADVVVCESYIITPATIKKSRQYDALYIIGATEYMARKSSTPFLLQPPSAKQFASDGKLRMLGWWYAGSDHVRDALRHALVYSVKEGHIPMESVVHDG